MWYQSTWLENEELGSELRDPGKIRMKKMENKHGKRRETNSDSDYMSPRLRAIAILKQEIAIMELQYEIALMEYEPGRHKDNGDAGEVMTRREEDDSERDVLACKDVQKLNGKMQEDRDGYYNREDDKDTESREKSEINRKHHKRKQIGDKDERSRDRKRRQDDDRDYHEEEEEESEGFNRNRSPETVSSDVNMKKRMMQKRQEQKRKKGYPDLATAVSEKRRRVATENRSATERFSSTKLALTTVQRLSATKWVMNNNITVLGITKQIKVDLWTNHDKFKEKCVYHQSRRDEPLPMLSLGDGVRI